MRKIGVLLALAVVLGGDEIERINSLVKEVESMRMGYEKCQEELKLCNKSLRPSSSSTKEMEYKKSLENLQAINAEKEKKIKNLQNQIINLKSQIQNYKSSLKNKDLRIASLEKEVKKLQLLRQKNKQKSKACTSTQKSVILLKKEKQQHLLLDNEKRVIVKEDYKVTITRPKTFRTLNEADIYDKPGGKKIDRWEKGRSFTSYMDAGEWVKITGYFIDRKWTKANRDLWIKRSDAFERD